MAAAELSEEAFRREVVEFLRENWIERPGGKPDDLTFRRAAVERGYWWRSVPKKYGGSEQPPNPLKALIIKEEFTRARTPDEVPGRIVHLLVGTLLAAGKDWQKEMFIRETLSGELRWCQGYSEPGAGSDVAGLRTKAELRGNEWVINGQKVWTSRAHLATHMMLLARTEPDAPKHHGISLLLVDMRQPGITVRQLRQITGDAEFNEVFFDDAHTPAAWIVGERGEGWAVSRTVLALERTHVGSADGSAALFAQLVRLAKTTTLNGAPAIKDPLIREEMARIHGMVAAHKAQSVHETNLLRHHEESSAGAGAFNKLYNSTIAEKIALVAEKIIGDVIMASPTPNEPGPARWINQYMNSIAAQIGGGTSNMQRNQIAERALGLPRDDAVI